MTSVRNFLLALQFFTRIPVTGALARWAGFSPRALRASAGHFPGVGLIVGMIAALAYAGFAAGLRPTPWTPLAAAVFSTIVTVLVTGGFHEDGLADTADGLGGSPLRERALEIMKDSRVGTFGVLAVALALLAKMSLLAIVGSIDLRSACAALLLAHVVSRALPLGVIRMLPHVGDATASKSKPLADEIGFAALAIALVWTALGVAVAAQWLDARRIGMAMGASIAGFTVMTALLRRRLQGFTGDGLGATQQVCELACYFGCAM